MPLDEWRIPTEYFVPASNGNPPQITIRPNPLYDPAPVEAVQTQLPVDASGVGVVPNETTGFVGTDKLIGAGGQERYQTWPERMVRDALAAPHDVLNNPEPMTSAEMIKPANDVAALASGGSIPFASKGALGSFGGKLVQVEHDPFAAPTFYSALEKAVEANPQGKMSGEQWLGTLKNKPGVKPEEIEYIGLENFLAGKKEVTKPEVQDFIKNNKIELGEMNKGSDGLHKFGTPEEQANATARLQTAQDRFRYTAVGTPEFKAASKEFEDAQKAMIDVVPGWGRAEGSEKIPTKFQQYQLPGGENYREKLLTLPNKQKDLTVLPEDYKLESYLINGEKKWAIMGPGTEGRMERYGSGSTPEAAMQRFNTLHRMNGDFKSSHWDEPNVLAHMRMNDRVIDGKKSLHLEEIQSDWHQKGRNEGYKISDELKAKADKIDEKLLEHPDSERIMGNPDLNAALKEATDKKIITQSEADTYKKVASNENSNIPDAPFKKTWHELVLKKALREAAEGGYDRLSWTPGEAQAARYDLSKQVDSIKVEGVKEAPGVHFVDIKPKNGPEINLEVENGKVREGEHLGKSLADIVGKDMAEKILSVKKGNKEFSGEGLKIGGEGMKGFYDQIIPKAVEKLTGEKVQKGNVGENQKFEIQSVGAWKGKERVQVYDVMNTDKSALMAQFNSKKEAQAYIDKQKAKAHDVHYIDITPALKEKAMKGFPLFSSGPVLVPVDHDPWAKHKLVPVDGNPFND